MKVLNFFSLPILLPYFMLQKPQINTWLFSLQLDQNVTICICLKQKLFIYITCLGLVELFIENRVNLGYCSNIEILEKCAK